MRPRSSSLESSGSAGKACCLSRKGWTVEVELGEFRNALAHVLVVDDVVEVESVENGAGVDEVVEADVVVELPVVVELDVVVKRKSAVRRTSALIVTLSEVHNQRGQGIRGLVERTSHDKGFSASVQLLRL